MVIMASGIARGRVRTYDDDDDDGVAQHGGHTSNNRLPETYSLSLPCTHMVLAGWEVRIGKNCDRGLEDAAPGRRPRALCVTYM